MNAIIALCHFCENHGPSVLFYTQAFHCEEHNPLLSGETSSSKECGSCLKRCLPRSVSESSTSFSAAPPSKSSQCEACRSLDPLHSGYISYDREAHISYYSNRYPEQQELYSIVRQACVRSLSCEVCQGREGPMFFGEEATGYVFTHTFFLKDINARGFQRCITVTSFIPCAKASKYSIIAVMKDRIYLINSWPFLCSQFRDIIDELQAKANTVYDAELAEHPQRTQQLQSTALAPDHFRRQRGSGNLKYRSIVDLTRDKNLFAHLHKSFAWILKACGIRVTERLLEGPPKEELLTDLEADDVTTRGKTYNRDAACNEDQDKDTEESDPKSPKFKSLRHMLKVLGRHYFHLLAYHVIQGNQLIVRGRDRHVVQSALHTLKMLIPSGCCQCIPYSAEYKDSWRCNFLGLAPEVEIPSHVLSSDLFVLLDIISSTNEIGTNGQEEDKKNDEAENFERVSFVVCGKEKEPSPTLLLKIENSLDNDNVTDNVFEQMLVCLKEEWMDKVKVVFKFARSKLNKQEEKEKLLQILGAKPEDEIVLKFWMTGLNRQYRSHLLTCSSSPTS